MCLLLHILQIIINLSALIQTKSVQFAVLHKIIEISRIDSKLSINAIIADLLDFL